MRIGTVITPYVVTQNLKFAVEGFCLVTETLACLMVEEIILINSFSTQNVFICPL
jgi:hypothetical protein